jgi:hypothetical protein
LRPHPQTLSFRDCSAASTMASHGIGGFMAPRNCRRRPSLVIFFSSVLPFFLPIKAK